MKQAHAVMLTNLKSFKEFEKHLEARAQEKGCTHYMKTVCEEVHTFEAYFATIQKDCLKVMPIYVEPAVKGLRDKNLEVGMEIGGLASAAPCVFFGVSVFGGRVHTQTL